MSVTSNASYRLSEEQQSYAATCLNEQDDVRDEKIAEVRRWLFSGGGTCTCVVYTTNEFFILRFLRSCKFNVETVKRKMKNYFNQRKNLPEWFAKRDPYLPEIQELLNIGIFLPLRKQDHEGSSVIIMRACTYDPSIQKMSDVLKMSMMILDISMRSNVQSTLYGVKVIIDLEGASMGHVLQLPPHVLKQLVHSWQDCYPLRIKGIHFVNPPPFLNVVLSIIKGFMGKKLKNRIHIHSKYETLLESLDSNILPSRYSGTGEDIDSLRDYWKSTLESNVSWFADEEANDALWSKENEKDCLSKMNSKKSRIFVLV